MSALEKGNDPVALDRASSHEVAEKVTAPEAVEQVDEHEVAARGHFATDKYGRPLVHFDPVAEAKLRLKIDCYVVPTVAMLYLFCFIDRANIGNAKLAGLEKDLGMKGYDYNIVLTCFYVSYIAFEIPANLLCKLVGPGWFLPATTLGFGLLSLCTAFVHSRGQACAVRFLLGVFEVGGRRMENRLDKRNAVLPEKRLLMSCLFSIDSGWDDARSILLPVTLVPKVRARLPPVPVHRDGPIGRRVRRPAGVCHPQASRYR